MLMLLYALSRGDSIMNFTKEVFDYCEATELDDKLVGFEEQSEIIEAVSAARQKEIGSFMLARLLEHDERIRKEMVATASVLVRHQRYPDPEEVTAAEVSSIVVDKEYPQEYENGDEVWM